MSNGFVGYAFLPFCLRSLSLFLSLSLSMSLFRISFFPTACSKSKLTSAKRPDSDDESASIKKRSKSSEFQIDVLHFVSFRFGI